MSDVQRPTLLTVLAVLAIIGGVLSCILAIILLVGIGAMFASGAGKGVVYLIVAVLGVGAPNTRLNPLRPLLAPGLGSYDRLVIS